jgi:NAD-dependent SIR2 family protein deacetylase
VSGLRLDALVDLVAASRRLLVLTGAGCSTDSGIPDYRDGDGAWKVRQPMTWAHFSGSEHARRRYWAGSIVGWRRIAAARPNPAHRALAELEAGGRIHHLITQNVDALHQRAGSRRVTDLHGRLDRLRCIECGGDFARQRFQRQLEESNPEWARRAARVAPDGDAGVDASQSLDGFQVPTCPGCCGVLKPDVVFFGESVPRERVGRCYARLEEADALLVVGSSLMVWSGYRFVQAARQRGLPVAAVNLGTTRADAELSLKVSAPASTALSLLVDRLVEGPALRSVHA